MDMAEQRHVSNAAGANELRGRLLREAAT